MIYYKIVRYIFAWLMPGRIMSMVNISAKMSKASTVLRASKSGFKGVYVYANDILGSMYFYKSNYESRISEIIRAYILPGDIVVDVGSCYGWHSLEMSLAVGNEGQVFSFEPNPHVRRLHEASIALNSIKNIRLLPYATSNMGGSRKLSTNNNEQGIINLGMSNIDVNGDVDIVAVRLDDVLNDHLVKRIKLIKIDVEGEEYNTLLGMKCILKSSRPVMVIEICNEHLQKKGCSVNDIHSFLLNIKYEMYRIENHMYTRLWNVEDYSAFQNILCIPVE